MRIPDASCQRHADGSHSLTEQSYPQGQRILCSAKRDNHYWRDIMRIKAIYALTWHDSNVGKAY